jgi:hypothetical protein
MTGRPQSPADSIVPGRFLKDPDAKDGATKDRDVKDPDATDSAVPARGIAPAAGADV